MSDLTNPQDSLKLLHSLLSKSTDTLTQGQKNTFSTEKSTVSVGTDTALTPTAVTPTVSAPSVHALTVTKPVQDEENAAGVSASVRFGDKSLRDGPWPLALERAEALAAQLVQLSPPILRIDVDGRARGYRPLKGLQPDQVHQVVRWTLEALERAYPTPSSVAVIAQWPGAYPHPTTNTPLWTWSAEHQPEPEPAPQLAPWARALLEGAEQVQYPVVLELTEPMPETQSLSRLCESHNRLVATLAELSRYTPREARLLKAGTLEPLLVAHA